MAHVGYPIRTTGETRPYRLACEAVATGQVLVNNAARRERDQEAGTRVEKGQRGKGEMTELKELLAAPERSWRNTDK